MYYVGNYEKEVIPGGSTKEYDYIYTPEGLTAIAVKTNGTRSLYYVQTDHLGSIRLVTDASKITQTRYYYDAWGKQTLVFGTSITNRGYIGEEHLNDFGLLNLNARIYDPALGRFLEMDPYVQMPDYTQSFNRYLYAMNNPLKYSDPNGENPLFILAGFAAFMYLFNAHANTPHNKASGNPGNWAWNPTSWNSTIVGNVGYNTGGNWTFSGGIGNPNGLIPVMGYNTQYGPSVGVNNYGSTSMYYPGYENRVNNAIGQNMNNAVNNARQDYFNSGLAVVGLANSGYGNIQQYNAMDLATSLERSGTWNPALASAYEKELIKANVANLKSYYAGKAIGILNGAYIGYQWYSGQINTSQMTLEEGSNLFVTLAKGGYGVAWAVGWEGGRQITFTNWYQEMKFNFWRDRMETLYGPPSESNRYLWETFYREYFK